MSYILIFGYMGMPRLGTLGAAIATLIANKKVTVLFAESDGEHSVTGAVEQVSDDQLTLKLADKVITVPLAKIIKANLVIEF